MNSIRFKERVTIRFDWKYEHSESEFQVDFIQIGRDYIDLFRFEENWYQGKSWIKKVLVESISDSEFFEWHIEE